MPNPRILAVEPIVVMVTSQYHLPLLKAGEPKDCCGVMLPEYVAVRLLPERAILGPDMLASNCEVMA